MRTKMWKAAILVATAGTLFAGLGGCLSGDFLGQVLTTAIANQFSGLIPDVSGLLGGLGGA